MTTAIEQALIDGSFDDKERERLIEQSYEMDRATSEFRSRLAREGRGNDGAL